MAKALVVDDSRLTRSMECQLLEECGFEHTQADNGETALELFAADTFDLMIVDLVMPKLDGLAFTQKVREKNREIPIVVVSSVADPRYIHRALELGANDYLVKPIDRELFLEKVRGLVPVGTAARSAE